MIPKIIHYCWFGGNEKPKLTKKCIKSWKKYCKEYEIIEWNESNFNIAASPLYVRQAYDAKKWAFVSDYVRLWVLTKFGGIYMDTDMELISPLDIFLADRAFIGFENEKNIAAGIIACEKNNEFLKKFMQSYDSFTFIKEDGNFDLTPNVWRITQKFVNDYELSQNGEMQVVGEFSVYPKDYFYPLNYETQKIMKTKNTYACHHYAASWISGTEKRRLQKQNRNIQIDRIIHWPNRTLLLLLGEKRYKELKSRIKK